MTGDTGYPTPSLETTPVLDPDKFGFVLWEGFTLLLVIFGGIGILVLRRRFSGKPAFTDRDRQLFFGHPKVARSTPRLLINFGTAVLLCSFVVVVEKLIFASLGPVAVTVVVLFSSLGIVNRLLF
jgi:hypothetical protein